MLTLLALVGRRAMWRLALGILFGLADGAVNMLVLRTLQTQIASGSKGHAIMMVAVAIFVFGVLSRVVLSYTSGRLIYAIAADAVMQLRLELAARLTTVSLAEFEKVGAPRVHHLLSDEVAEVEGGITVLPLIAMNGSVLLASIVYLGWLSWLTLAFALLGVAAGFGMSALGHRLTKISTMNRALRQAELQHEMEAIIDACKELRTHEPRRLQFLSSELAPAAGRMRVASIKSDRVTQVLRSTSNIMIWGTIGLVLFVAPWFGGADSSAALVVLFLLGPVGDVVYSSTQIARGSFAYGRIRDLLGGMQSDTLSGEPAPVFDDEISLRAVQHSYRSDRGDHFRIGPVDLTIRRGEIVFLIGGNGSGKTTLAKLLVGFYAPESGLVELDGRPIDSDKARLAYRQLFSTIFGSYYVFPWLLDQSPEREESARALLLELGLQKIVRVRDGRFITTALSSGQKKRLALVGALLEDRPIYVLDEWAADQDPEWKRVFYENILPRMKASGKTVIVVTHDDQYFNCTDRVIKLESGRVISDVVVARQSR